MKCKNCKKEDAIKYSKYTNGKFCSVKCSRSFSSKAKRQEINKKVSEKLKGRTTAVKIEKICPVCNLKFYVFKKKKNQISCSNKCSKSNPEYLLTLSKNMIKRCKNPKERKRLRDIGRKGGFGKKGYTKSGIYYQSSLEKKAFEYLEDVNIEFVPHKNILNSSKISDIYIVKNNLWIELDGIDREKRKKWLGKDYFYWIEKLEIYKSNNLNYKVVKSFEELKLLLNNTVV